MVVVDQTGGAGGLEEALDEHLALGEMRQQHEMRQLRQRELQLRVRAR
jgi:hypothetical protein